MRIGSGLSLFVGGARSGKSDVVVRLGQSWPGDVVFVATATAGDEDMADRIARHQDERPSLWGLVESPEFSSDELAAVDPGALVIVDCVTLLVSNLLFADRTDDQIVAHVAALAESAAARSAPTLVVSNEVGLGVHPESALGRRYRDVLGRANRQVADAAETSLFVVAGRAIPLQEIEITW